VNERPPDGQSGHLEELLPPAPFRLHLPLPWMKPQPWARVVVEMPHDPLMRTVQLVFARYDIPLPEKYAQPFFVQWCSQPATL
jgi:hypothetical protein